MFWKLSERAGSQIASLVIQVVLARLLDPEDFGALAIILIFVNLCFVVVQSGLNTALIQAPEITEADYSTVFWCSTALSLVMYVILFVVSPVIATAFSMEHIVWPLRVLALLLFINAFNGVQVAKAARELSFRKVFIATIYSVLVSGGVGVVVAICGLGLWSLVLQQICYQVVNCVALAWQIRWLPSFAFRLCRAKTLYAFSWKLLVSSLLDVGYSSLSDLIIGKQFGAAELGMVSQGAKYPSAIGRMLDGSIQPVMLSVTAKVQNDIDRVRRLVRRALKTSSYVIFPVMALFALIAHPLVYLLLGEKWLPCVPFLQMYCFVYALLPIHTTNLQALNGIGRSDLFLKLEVIKKAYGLLILIAAAVLFRDVYAIVAGYMITATISTFINAYPNRKTIDYSYMNQIRDIAPACFLALLSCGVAALIGLIPLQPFARVLLQCFAMLGSYLLFSKLLKLEAFEYIVETGKEIFSQKAMGGRQEDDDVASI